MKNITQFEDFINESAAVGGNDIHKTLLAELKPFGFAEETGPMRALPHVTSLYKGEDGNGIAIGSVKGSVGTEWEWTVSKGGKLILIKKATQSETSPFREQDGAKIIAMIKKDLAPYLKMTFPPMPHQG